MSEREIPPLPEIVVREVVQRALAEDLGRGDLTTDACVPMSVTSIAELGARDALVVSGLRVFSAVFEAVDPSVAIELTSCLAVTQPSRSSPPQPANVRMSTCAVKMAAAPVSVGMTASAPLRSSVNTVVALRSATWIPSVDVITIRSRQLVT